jgi:hypothetical protein
MNIKIQYKEKQKEESNKVNKITKIIDDEEEIEDKKEAKVEDVNTKEEANVQAPVQEDVEENLDYPTEINTKKQILIKNINGTKNKVCMINENDRKMFNSIEEILNNFNEIFHDKNPENILDALKVCSFNIENTYLFLKDPNTYKSKLIFII